MFKNKKGQAFEKLASMGIGLATLAIVLTVAFLIMSQGKTQIIANEGLNATGASGYSTSIAYNSTSTLQNATGTVPGWIPLVIIASIGAVLIGLTSLFRRG